MNSRIFTYPCGESPTCHPIPITLYPGKYFIECYGAQGGTGYVNAKLGKPGGKGAYASGILVLLKKVSLFLHSGSRGQDGIPEFDVSVKGGWGGGGNGGTDTNGGEEETSGADTPGGGGGATDIRLVKAPDGEESTNLESLDSRFIVAAGGSGSAGNAYGAPGGDLMGYKMNKDNSNTSYIASNTTQENDYQKGQGAKGVDSGSFPASGAGGGYYGGKSGTEGSGANTYLAVSSSGSSYAAGFVGCPQFSHSLGRNFDNVLLSPQIKSGFSSFPSLSYDVDHSLETGHEGDGAIKITYLSLCSFYHRKEHNNMFIFALINI